MKKSLLYGIFLFVIGISMIVTYYTTKQVSYAYLEEEKYSTIFNYVLEENKDVNLEEIGYFQILDENYEVIKSFDLKINDSITVNTLNKDRYILRQMKTPLNYNSIDDIYFDVLEKNNVVNLKTKLSTSSKLGVMLIDIKNNKVLTNAEFHLLDLENNIISSCTTISGYCMMNDITKGNYILENVIPSDGYILAKQSNVTFDDKITTNYVNIYTSATKATINLYDKMTEYPILGGTFKLYDINYNELYLINKNNYEIEGLKEGVYYLKEITAPNGYEISNREYSFEIKNDSKDLNINIYHNRINNDFLTSNIFYLLGCFIFISSIIILVFICNKHKFSNKVHNKNR